MLYIGHYINISTLSFSLSLSLSLSPTHTHTHTHTHIHTHTHTYRVNTSILKVNLQKSLISLIHSERDKFPL